MSREYVSNAIKKTIKELAEFRCEYCQSPENYCPATFSIDHIIPSSLGGESLIENLCTACHGCNWAKSNKMTGIDPETSEEVSLFHPRQDIWTEHFQWSKSNLEIIGLTPIGRATIATLKLNRPSLVNLRYALTVIKKHPPNSTV